MRNIVTASSSPFRWSPDRPALQDRRRVVADLTPQELQDVVALERQVRAGQAHTRSVRQRCIDEEVRREDDNPSSLAWEVIRLKCRD